MVAAPPCETRSAVRWRELAGGGPIPFGDTQNLWGARGLGAKERKHLWMGSFLCRSTVELFVELVWSGGDALMEHPAMPVWVERSASSWCLPQLQLLRRHPAAEYLEFDQCEHGAQDGVYRGSVEGDAWTGLV